MHFGATLRLLRVDAGVSLRALAQQIGVSSAYLSRVENGHDQAPTTDRLIEIARALRLPSTLLIDLAHRVTPFVARYLEEVPTAGHLFLEIARRRLGAAQLARVHAFIAAEFPGGPAQTDAPPRLSDLLRPERVVLSLSCDHIGDAIDVAAARLASAVPGWSAARLAEEIARREREAPTCVGNGVAIPHTFAPTDQPAAALVTLARPLHTTTPDAVPLQLLLVVAGRGPSPLELLARAARLAAPSTVAALAAANSPAAALDCVRRSEAEFG
jgi:PTS system nitrogen regulatory IIA component